MIVAGRDSRLLKWDARYDRALGALTCDETCYSFTGIDAARMLEHLRTLCSSQAIGKPELPRDDHLLSRGSLIQALEKCDLLRPISEGSVEIAPEDFAFAVAPLLSQWKQRLFSHSLWSDLASGRAKRSQFIGWLIESYHFIEGVNERLALAVGHCSSSRARALFAKHYTEEYDHADFFLRSLEGFGVPSAIAQRLIPLTSTNAIRNHMRHCARRSALDYAVCSGFLESTGVDRTKGRQFFERLANAYALENPSAIGFLQAHLNLDEGYGHNGILAAVCQAIGPVSLAQASSALLSGALLVETLEMWSAEIQEAYRTELLRLALPASTKSAPTDKAIGQAQAMPLRSGRLKTQWSDTNSFVVESSEIELTLDESSSKILSTAWDLLDGFHALESIAGGVGCTVQRLSPVLQCLAEERLLIDRAAIVKDDSEQFISTYRCECEFWAAEITGRPFWQKMLAGELSESQIFGWALEFYHFVEAANEHMPLGIASTKRVDVHALLGKHFAEEAFHSDIFGRALQSVGFSAALIEDAAPLPATRALINYLNELALADTVGYIATFGVMQQGTTVSKREGVNRFFDSLESRYPFAAPIFSGFRKHALIDEDMDHHSLVIERLWETGWRPDLTQRHSVAEAVRGVAEAFMLFFDQILEYYGAYDARLPRRSPDIRWYFA